MREEVSRAEALERFADQPYKREIIEGLGAGARARRGRPVTIYRNDGWEDLCMGPHLPSTKRLGSFKLLSLAGAYWRGDETRPMLTASTAPRGRRKDDLDAYLHRLEEAERRDHRKLGRQLDLFSFPEELGPGLVIWHPRGGIFRKQMEDYVRDLHLERGYDIVQTPHIAQRVLWDTSGHTAKYLDTMYPDDGARRGRLLREADELPVPRAHLQVADALATATCRCACPSSAPSTGSSGSGRCTACCGSAATQDDSHIICRGTS